jgi:vesicular inhibitory amino acid transporter
LDFAGMNALCGVGILSTPYALNEGGWAALGILLLFAALSFYTGLLLRYCLDSEPGLETYPDIGQAAFGTLGRVIISVSRFFRIIIFHEATTRYACRCKPFFLQRLFLIS